MTARLAAAAACAAVVCAVALRVRGQDAGAGRDGAAAGDPRAEQGTLVARAQIADEACRPADALPSWQAAAAAAPGTRLARLAQRRVADITLHDAGGLAPLARLCTVRRDARRLDRPALLAYARELDATPPGLVRREGRAVVAESLAELGDGVGAEAAWAALAREPGATSSDRRIAAEGVAAARASRGDLAGAIASMDAAGLGRASATARWRRERVRRVGRTIAWTTLALFAVAAAAGARRARRRGRRLLPALGPWRVGIAAWALGGPLLLAGAYDAETLDTFGTFAVAGGVLLVLASLAGVALAGASRGRRALVALAAASSVLAAGYLVLDRAGVLIDLGL